MPLAVDQAWDPVDRLHTVVGIAVDHTIADTVVDIEAVEDRVLVVGIAAGQLGPW